MNNSIDDEEGILMNGVELTGQNFQSAKLNGSVEITRQCTWELARSGIGPGRSFHRHVHAAFFRIGRLRRRNAEPTAHHSDAVLNEA